MGVLTVADLIVGYSPTDEILKGVGFDVGAGEIVGVIGPNGAGKSTLLKAIAGLLRPSRGTIALNGEPIGGHAPRDICRRGLAYVPQENNIFPSMSVRENLEMGGFADPGGARRRIDAVFARFDVLARKRRQVARALSGGERQILAMAMALMVDPTVLLLDEPSAGLSPIAAERLFESIQAINREGVSIVMVEQNAREALAIATRAYILVDGRNSRSGPAAALAADPDIQRLFLGA
ncbi:MAG: ABC transporter ATP-binding protein [Proteobacteria bacterium]|nr:ABC transporter ATP-binding protein [Pseudomonadota bacterium]